MLVDCTNIFLSPSQKQAIFRYKGYRMYQIILLYNVHPHLDWPPRCKGFWASRRKGVLSFQILTPFLLRRLKSDVTLEVPPKKEIIVYAPLTAKQEAFYTAVVNKTIAKMLGIDKVTPCNNKTSSTKCHWLISPLPLFLFTCLYVSPCVAERSATNKPALCYTSSVWTTLSSLSTYISAPRLIWGIIEGMGPFQHSYFSLIYQIAVFITSKKLRDWNSLFSWLM